MWVCIGIMKTEKSEDRGEKLESERVFKQE